MAVNRIRKQVLVDEDKLPPETRSVELAGGGGPATTADYVVDQQMRSSFISPLEKAIIKHDSTFKDEIMKIIQKPLPDKLISLEILRRVNHYLNHLQKWEDEQRDKVISEKSSSEIPSKLKTLPSTISMTTPPKVEDPSVKQTVGVDFESVWRHGKEKQPFSKENISKSLHARIRPRFQRVLDQLETKSGFAWDPESGKVRIRKRILPNSDLRDLILHKVRMDINDPVMDAPPSFKQFNTFLNKTGINSNPALRPRKVATATRRNEVAGKRDKMQTLIGSSSGHFVRY